MMVNDFGRFEYHIYLTRNYNGILQKDVFSYPCGGRYNHYSLSIDLRQCGANNTHDMRAWWVDYCPLLSGNITRLNYMD